MLKINNEMKNKMKMEIDKNKVIFLRICLKEIIINQNNQHLIIFFNKLVKD
jgi:hypothetical protein